MEGSAIVRRSTMTPGSSGRQSSPRRGREIVRRNTASADTSIRSNELKRSRSHSPPSRESSSSAPSPPTSPTNSSSVATTPQRRPRVASMTTSGREGEREGSERDEGGDNERIRVVCRFRPSTDQEILSGGQECIQYDSDGRTLTITTENRPRHFMYSRVFDGDASQEDVYHYSAQPLVAGVLRGVSAAIIAYGQTGAGKTYTMQGPGFDDPRVSRVAEGVRGIIPRVVTDIFEYIRLESNENIRFEVAASYLEIYQEQVRDLFVPKSDWQTSPKLVIMEGEDGLMVPEARHIAVYSPSEVIDLMQQGARNRVVASTNMNEESSRSHAIFLVTVACHTSTSKRSAQLYLVDLAGSEKVSKTQAEGMRLSEAGHINKSLLALANVIHALVSRKKHIPYRDSKLTRLLKNSFGGNARTSLIINCSPNSYNAQETLSTLRFGDRTSQIKNKPKVNEQRSAAVLEGLLAEQLQVNKEQAALIEQLQLQIQQLVIAQSTLPTAPSSTLVTTAPATTSISLGANDKGKEIVDHVRIVNNDESDQRAYDVEREEKEEAEREKREVTQNQYRKEMNRREMLYFLCPLSRALFIDPVVASDGHTYERRAIETWLQCYTKSPLTGNKIAHTQLYPNYNMRRQIAFKHYSNFDFMSILPFELLVTIFEYLDYKSILRCQLVCALFRDVGMFDGLWSVIFARDFATIQATATRRSSKKQKYEAQVKSMQATRRAAMQQDQRRLTTGYLTLLKT